METAAKHAPPTPQGKEIGRGLILLLAVGCGLTIANLYYMQPLLDLCARTMGIGAAAAGLLITLSQFGFVIGLLAIVPLGDVVQRRWLTTALVLLSAVALAVAATAKSFAVLAAAMVVIGTGSVVAQVIVPFAATLAHGSNRGRVVGTVMMGLMLGTMLSRTLSGFVASWGGWRLMFWISAGSMLALALVLARSLPDMPRQPVLRYDRLLRSVGNLVAHERVLQLRSFYGALNFATFSAFWTILAFQLSDPPFSLTPAMIGLIGLIGIPCAFAAPHAGRMADSGWGRPLTGMYVAITVAAVTLVWLGADHLWLLLVGALALSMASGCLHVTNQSIIYRLDVAASSRLTTAYMSTYFVGGMAGSALGSLCYADGGWTGACIFVGALSVVSAVTWMLEAGWAWASFTPSPARRHDESFG